MATLSMTSLRYSWGSGTLILNPFTGSFSSDAFTRLFVINAVVMPMPLGVVAALRFPVPTHRLALGFTAFYVLVESLQYVRGGGRTADLQDVLLNSSGATVAAALVAVLAQPLICELHRVTGQPTPDSGAVRRSALVSAGTAALIVTPVVAAALADSPTLPPLAGGAALSSQPSVCGLPEGEWAMPETAPEADTWETGRGPRPHSALFGPGMISEDVGSCFALNPTGALFAAAWTLESDLGRLAGYWMTAASPDLVEVDLAVRTEGNLAAWPFEVRWRDGDWEAVRHVNEQRSLDSLTGTGFVEWTPDSATPPSRMS